MIEAVIFDMDGLLIDSEPLWRKAEVLVFGKNGLQLTEEECMQTTGLRIDKVVEYWQQRNSALNFNVEEMVASIEQEVGSLIQREGKPLPGVFSIIEILSEIGLPLAVASSSSTYLINIVLEKLQIRSFFKAVLSAENLKEAKPDPEIFLLTAKKLGVKPNNCLVFEDSKHGVEAGLAANMKVVAVPAKENYDDAFANNANMKLQSLDNFDKDSLKQIGLL